MCVQVLLILPGTLLDLVFEKVAHKLHCPCIIIDETNNELQHCSFSGKCQFFFDVFSKHWTARHPSVEEPFHGFCHPGQSDRGLANGTFSRKSCKIYRFAEILYPSPEMSTRAFDQGKVNHATLSFIKIFIFFPLTVKQILRLHLCLNIFFSLNYG